MSHTLSSLSDPYTSTCFTPFIIKNNLWSKGQFSKWVFSPGMLFNATDKWWGDMGKRTIPHEGIDLGLYEDGNGCINGLAPSTYIPAMHDGRIVKIMDDFLGKTIIMEHSLVHENGHLFLTLYGHTRPIEKLRINQTVKKGDIVCSISSPLKTRILPHLHISLAKIVSPRISYPSLDWNMIPKTDMLTLLDPLPTLDGSFDVQTKIDMFDI